MVLFTLKYAPTSSAMIAGQSLAVSQLKDFVLHHSQQRRKAALLSGPIGVGKTCSVYALAQELKYDLLEVNSSDVRNSEAIHTFLSSALGQQSLFFRPKIILIDEIDALSGTDDRGCIPAMVKALEKTSFPVIFTANDLSDSKFNALRKLCLEIEYQKLDHHSVLTVLQMVCDQEKIIAEEKAMSSLARQADGDLRAALIDLQTCAAQGNITFSKVTQLSDRQRTESITTALNIIFKSSAAENAISVLDNIDVDLNEVFLWLDENLPREYLTPQALARAYEHLSRADVFQGRIRRRQHWRFLVYITNLLTAGISSAKEQRNPQSIEYKRTMRILKIWQANQKFAKRKEIAAKLAEKTHTSRKVALEQLPYFQELFRNGKSEAVAEELGLTEEEVEWLQR